MYCEDIQDMDLTNALQSLMTSVLKSKVTEWIASQATFNQALFGNIRLEN